MMEGNFEFLLAQLFDYQRFEGNAQLAKLLSDTAERYPRPLEDKDLELVNAAGEWKTLPVPKISGGREDE